MKLKKFIYTVTLGLVATSFVTSCDDMLDKGNDYVIYADDHMLNNPADTVTSVLGILNKLQAIAVRNNLLGEVRADLVNVTSNATDDLKDLADFNANVTGEDDANMYNVPRDYFAVINNCNYFLAYADSTAGNVNRNEKYFEDEIAQVHCIRAWAYLQLVLAYGRVPLVTEPVLTKIQSEATYPMVELEEICDYFINDLKPYYAHQYPEYNNIGGDIAPKFCFYPSQIVMGDLYLYKAAVQGRDAGKASARQAAKSYYDYIIWDQNNKKNLFTGTNAVTWSAADLYAGRYMNPSGNINYQISGVWGALNNYNITAIPMDSAAADGYYNELRNLYNTTNTTSLKEASITPSDVYKKLSSEQSYVGRDTYGTTKTVERSDLTEEEINKNYLGDLRYQNNWSQNNQKYNGKEVKMQSIRKHSSQHISIYRGTQLYLRMAEALNYAGYPRFARQILTMGLNNNVIQYEVSPYYQANGDSAFIAYFDFNTNTFKPYAQSYTQVKDSLGVAVLRTTVNVSSDHSEANMLGVHSRGSGDTYLNTEYCKLCSPDSTSFPYAVRDAVGSKPTTKDYTWPEEVSKPHVYEQPVGWEENNHEKLSEEAWKAMTGKKSGYATYEKQFDNYYNYIYVELPAYKEAYAQYVVDSTAVANVFNKDLTGWEGRLATYQEKYDEWNKSVYSNSDFISKEQDIVDQAILDEQALELSYEGNRYYDLMRRALWKNDNNIMVKNIGARTSAASKLSTRTNWYLNWKNKIGY